MELSIADFLTFLIGFHNIFLSFFLCLFLYLARFDERNIASNLHC